MRHMYLTVLVSEVCIDSFVFDAVICIRRTKEYEYNQIERISRAVSEIL